jgi:hypothetical protein
MSRMKSAVAVFIATAGVSAGFASAPIALAQEASCDPAAGVCEGDVQPGTPQAAAPTVSDDQYPTDEDWYFNPAGGGTALQPAHPSGGGGGGHR